MSPAHRVRNRRGWVFWTVLVIILLLIGWVSWIAVRGLIAQDNLTVAVRDARAVQTRIVSGDTEAAGASARSLSEHAELAAAMTHDPIWAVTEVLPWVGPNLAAVRQITEVVDSIAGQAVLPLVDVSGTIDLESFQITDQGIDLAPIVAARGQLDQANQVMTAATDKAGAIDVDSTVGVVRESVLLLTTVVGEAADAIDALDRTANLLPAMLGEDGARKYIVLIQNNAEVRASGGISGAQVLLATDQGKVSLAAQASSQDFPYFEEPVLPLDAPTLTLYGKPTGQYIQDVNFTPQFTTTGPLAAEMWRRVYGDQVDGVIAIDPVLLSYLLVATGPVTVDGVEITADNAVTVLLSDVYARYSDPEAQDAFFAEAARQVFARVTSGQAPATELVAALVRGGEEQRIRIWNSREQDQAQVVGTTLSGVMPADNSETTQIGVFLNDATGAKMNYYTKLETTLAAATCRKDGRPSYRVTATWTNEAPADAASVLPDYVTGGGGFGVEPGSVKTRIVVYGPVGALIAGGSVNGENQPSQPTYENERPALQFETLLKPGESAVVQVDFLGEAADSGPLLVTTTPTINLMETNYQSLPCNSSLH